MGGEKAKLRAMQTNATGSPPRGRGKVSSSVFVPVSMRITPAWAGKSISQTSTMKPAKDHPRVGGEKLALSSCKQKVLGSPPRGRGEAYGLSAFSPAGRITPAWAGKSQTESYGTTSSEDHPRVGGEKSVSDGPLQKWRGSPPRGRGKEGLLGQDPGYVGITPAWAGKRSSG